MILIIIFSVYSFSLHSQNDANWVLGDSIGIDFRHNPPKYFRTQQKTSIATSCTSNDKGDLVLYSDDNDVWEANGYKLKRTIFDYASGTFINSNLLLKAPGYTNKYYLFRIAKHTKIAELHIFYWVIDYDTLTHHYIYTKEFIRLDTDNDNYIWNFAIFQHNNKTDYWLSCKESDTKYVSWLIDKNGIGKEVISKVINNSPYADKNYKQYNGYSAQYYVFDQSHSANYLYENMVFYRRNYTNKSGSVYYDSFSLKIIQNTIDAKTGIISFNKVLYTIPSSVKRIDVFGFGLSNNDSVLYWCYSTGGLGNFHFKQLKINKDNSISATELLKNHNNPSEIYGTFRMGPDGIMYCGKFCDRFYFGRIMQPDKEANQIQWDTTNYISHNYYRFGNGVLLQSYPTVFLPYHKLFLHAENTCNNKGMYLWSDYDTSYFTKFRWYLHLPHGKIDSADGASVYYKFPKSGIYKVRIKAIAPSGYAKWREDSVRYRAMPEASFTTSATELCQNTPLTAFAKCQRDTLFGMGKESYRWDFGDTIISNTNSPTHIYRHTGLYKVKLIYSDGFCNDSAKKKVSIRVLDAPKAMFKLEADKPCAPENIRLISTSTGNIKDTWFYLFKKGVLLDSLKGNNGFFTINNNGFFQIKQKVISTTGCITRAKDSVQFFKSIASSDVPFIRFVKTENDKDISINFTKLVGSKFTLIYRDNLRVGNTCSNHFTDSTCNVLQINNYQIEQTDSCGNVSAKSEIVKNIVLNSTLKNNDVILNWNNSFNNQKSSSVFIKGFDSFNTQNTDYIDTATFSDKNLLAKSYSVKGFNPKNSDYQSQSNIRIQPMPSVLFFPTSFTPDANSLNDKYVPVVYGYKDYSLKIYNRWGQLIYQGKEWNGVDTLADIYMYLFSGVKQDGDIVHKSGTIVLIK